MSTRVLGFVGVECYDLIIYIARVYKQLGKKVLIVDNSTLQSLSHCITGLIETNDGNPIDFGGITAVKRLKDLLSGFDFIIVYTGRHSHPIIEYATDIYLVTDYQKHNIEQLLSTPLDDDDEPVTIFRDRVTSKITPETVLSILSSHGFNTQKVYHLDDSTEDLASKVLCQYNHFDHFKKVSRSITQFITDVVSLDFDEKEVTKALKQAARRW